MTPRRSVSERLYRMALLTFPPSFRHTFADEMTDFARRRLRTARREGSIAGTREAIRLVVDIVTSAPRVWIHLAREQRRAHAAAVAADHLPRDNMNIFIQDVRFAARGLLRRPGFTLVAGLTLALGIGATTAIFSVVNAVLIRPLPYPNPDRLVTIWGTQDTQGQQGVVFADYLEWRAQNRSFEEMAVYRPQSVNLTGGDTPQRLIGSFISAGYLRIIGATPARGRLLTDAETEVATKAPVAVVSHDSWQARFGGDQNIIGKTLVLNGQPHTVVGITQPGLQAPPYGMPDVFIPVPYYPNASGLQRGYRGVGAIGLLKPGTTIENAQRDLRGIAKQQEENFPTTNKGFGVELQRLEDQIVGPTRAPIYIVFGAVVVVLLIACANVANLQLARGAARARELAVRAALGAGRSRIAQQLLTESILLSLAGGAVGVALAVFGTKWLGTALADALPFQTTISVDGVALAFATAASVGSGVLFGVAPSWKASRTDVQMLRTRSGSGGASHVTTRNGLVVVQLALSLTLLSCAGLLTRSLIELQRVDTGFATKNLMTMQFRLPAVKYDSPDKIWAMFDRSIAEIRTVPGVASAALVRAFPLTGNGDSYRVMIEGRSAVAPSDAPQVQINSITPEYFTTMEIPRRAGRDFNTSDTRAATPVIIVNATLAAKSWPNESALGKRIQFDGDDRWWTVVGVVGDTKHFHLNEAQLLQAYIPHAQRPQIFTTVAVRSTGDPLPLANAIRSAIWRVDQDQPVWGVTSIERLLINDVGSPRLMVLLTTGFAIVALLLGAIGIYGVLSYTMSQRTNELGIRIALGAGSAQVVRMVVGEGMRVVGVAVAIGLLVSLGATRLLRSQLFGVGPADLATFAVVTTLLGAVAVLACYIPARRASRVDPMVTLRAE